MKKKILLSVLTLLTFILIACSPRTVTITFETNGGNQMAAINVEQLKEITEPIPERLGYEFKGWFSNSELTEPFNFITGASRNITLYAKWQINEYEITLNYNNGDSNLVLTYEFNSTITITEPERTGYVFAGWFIDEDFKTSFTQTKMPAENLELHAKWAINTYTITFKVEGEILATRTVEHGQTLTNIPNVPTKVGYNANWSVSVFTNIENNLEVNAVYQIKTYQVVFKDNDGIVYNTQTIQHGDLVERPNNPNKPGYNFISFGHDFDEPVTTDLNIIVNFEANRHLVIFRDFNGLTIKEENVLNSFAATAPTPPNVNGYTFLRWDKDFSNVTSNLEVNAIYEANTYTLTLDANGGQFTGGTTVLTSNHAFDSEVLAPQTPTKTGYHFAGWINNQNQNVSFTLYMPAANLNLSATWTPIEYTIIYNNLFQSSANNFTKYTIETDTFTLVNPSPRSGYTFVGWFDANEGGNQITQITKGSLGNLTIYARWAVNTYTITLKFNDNITNDQLLVDEFNKTLDLPTPIRDGYTFAGWYKDNFIFSNPYTSNVFNETTTLYAKWNLQTYQITYELAAGITNTNRTSYTIETNTFNVTNLTGRPGYTFAGWFTDNDNFENQVMRIEKGTFGNITLYAKWNINSYNITYNDIESATNPNPTTYTILDNITLINLSKIGYTFVGWFDMQVGGNKIEAISNQTGNITLFARWNINTYTVTLKFNDGETVDELLTNNFNETLTLPTPTRYGYTFIGWFTDNDTFEDEYESNHFVETITLYAKWELAEFTLTFIVDGNLLKEVVLNYLEIVKESDIPTIPPKNHFDQVEPSWDINPLGHEVVGNQTFTVIYIVNEYTVTLKFNDGLTTDELLIDNYNETLTLPTPTRTGYSFAGWFTDNDTFENEYENNLFIETITLYAKWELVTYDITYELEVGITNPNPTTYTILDNITLINLSKTGYTFVGWFDANVGGSQITEIPKGSFGDLTIYARWIVNTYTVTLKFNDGETADQLLIDNYNQSLILPTPTRYGYTFIGWFTDDNTFEDEYESDLFVETITLYAKWELAEFTLTFIVDGNLLKEVVLNYLEIVKESDIPTIPPKNHFDQVEPSWDINPLGYEVVGNQTFTAIYIVNEYTVTLKFNDGLTTDELLIDNYNETLTLPTPTRTGYSFAGWFTDNDTFENEYQSNRFIETITLYAKWELVTYDITYELEVGITNPNPLSYTIETESFSLIEPGTKTGYTFVGWFDANVGGSQITEIPKGSLGDLTIYARWTINTYTITLKFNDGETADQLLIDNYNETLTLPTPTRAGYTFGGWFIDDLTFQIDYESNLFIETIILYAKWTEYPAINFVSNGGSNVNQISVVPETPIQAPNSPTRTGYTFAGWFTDNNTFQDGYIFSIMPTNDLTLYAKWNINTYSITYNDSESATNPNPITYTILDNITLINLSKTGYTFVGWYTQAIGGTKIETISSRTGNITLYAKWNINTYNITYNESESVTNPNPTTYTILDTITLINLTKTGYTFIGWFDMQVGGNKIETISNQTGNITLFARWTINEYTVTLKFNDGETVDELLTDSYNETLTLPIPTRYGYTFIGWFTDNDTFEDEYESNLFVETITLYAKWELAEFTLTFIVDGNLLEEVVLNYLEIVKESDIPTIPLKNHFDQVEPSWDINPLGHEVVGNQTFTVIYIVNEYTVTLKFNDGLTTDELLIDNYNETLTLPTPTRTGYSFAGWFTDNDTFENEYQSLVFTQTITLYARWIVNTYTVTLKFNDGETFDELLTDSYNETLTLPIPTRYGYTFIGWFTDDNTFEDEYESNLFVETITLYAKWELAEFTLTFIVDGNLLEEVVLNYLEIVKESDIPTIPPKNHFDQVEPSWDINPLGHEVVGNQTFTVIYIVNEYTVTLKFNDGLTTDELLIDNYNETLTLPTPTRTGYSFAGWFTDNDTFEDKYESNLFIETITLYAKWELVTYDITYELEVGITNPNPLSYTIETESFSLIEPGTKTGYTFVGWFDANVGGSQITEIPKGSLGDLTIYARWTINTYTITLKFNDGETVDQLLIDNYNETLTLPTPIRYGYTFGGWFTDDNTFENEYENNLFIETITLYAKWEIEEYTINFIIDGLVVKTITKKYLETITASDIPNIPNKNHFDQVEPNWNTTVLDYVVTSNQAFVAVYIPNIYTITFDVNNGEFIAPMNVTYGETYHEDMPTPTRNGYTFIAWYGDLELKHVFDSSEYVTEDITIYATYQINYYDIRVNEYYEVEDLNDSEIITIEKTTTINYRNLLYGISISPIDTYAGYVFNRFEYNGNTYVNFDDLILVEGEIDEDNIKVYYRKIIITISFYQDPKYFLGEPLGSNIHEVKIYYNESFEIANLNFELRGIEEGVLNVLWNRNQFINVKENLNVYAIYYLEDIKTLAFSDRGTIKYLVSQYDINNEDEIAIGIDAQIWTLSRPGWKFAGWYLESNFVTLVEPAEIKFGDLTGQTTYYAKWIELTSFTKPTINNITTNANIDEEEIVINFTLNPPTIEGEKPLKFIFVINNVEIEVQSNHLSLVLSQYTLIINDALVMDDKELFYVLFEVGKHEITIQAIGDNTNHYHGEVSNTYTFEVGSNEENYTEPSETEVFDYFIYETFEDINRYVFYANLTYSFNVNNSFEIITGHEFISVDPNNHNKLITSNRYGNFRFRKINNGVVTIYEGLVIPDLRGFTIGTNYQSYNNSTSTFIDPNKDPYYVGYANNYYLDIRLLNNQGSRIPLNAVKLEYEVYEIIGENSPIKINDYSDILTIYSNNEFKFKPLANGRSFNIVVKPYYQGSKMTVSPLSYSFTVNDGENVFTNQQLKQAFSNLNVNTINIHANIDAELSANQMNLDGSPKNIRPNSSNIASGTGDVYLRYSANTLDDSITINGNYMTIDGSNLPYSNVNSGSGHVGFAQAFEVVNVVVAIFGYDVSNSATPDVNNNKFNINNLQIIGNTTIPAINYGGTTEEILQQEQLMSRNSGGYMGILVEHGHANYHNLNIGFTVIGIKHEAYGYTDLEKTVPIALSNIDYVSINDTWANSIYVYASNGVVISNSQIGQSGGPAIHVVDMKPGNSGVDTPTIEIKASTSIENWVSGEEAWFKAYGMTPVALALKSNIEGGISDTERSIISLIDNPVTGFQSEMLNFILLTEPSNNAITYNGEAIPANQISGSEVKIIISDDTGTFTIQRPFNYLNSGDPRIIGGQYGFPIGINSDGALLSNLATQIHLNSPTILNGVQITPEQASDLAKLASFYNLNATEMLQVEGAKGLYGLPSYKSAIDLVIENHSFPKFFEVLAPVPSFTGGYSTVIIQLKDIN